MRCRSRHNRDSPDGQQVLTDIYDIVRGDILPRFAMLDQPLNNQDTEALLAPGQLDFNDGYIVKLCRDQNLVLLTNDADFKADRVGLAEFEFEVVRCLFNIFWVYLRAKSD